MLTLPLTLTLTPTLALTPTPTPTLTRYGHAAAIIDTAPTHAALCTLHGDGLRGAIAGDAAELRIVARDAHGQAHGSP